MPGGHSDKSLEMAKTYKRKRMPGTPAEQPVTHDLNIESAALLYEMAALQPTPRSQFGYKRAAKAVVYLPVPVSDLVSAGTLREVPFVGPSSERIIKELVATGRSAIVEAAIAKAGSKGEKVRGTRAYREHFLSHFAMGQALASPMGSEVVSRPDYRGDFQMHSTWSDGGEPLAAMIKGARELGHSCLGITDHSYGLPIARGMSMDQASRQWAEIDRLNAKHKGEFRVFKGVEANILSDGALDLQPDEAALFEFVVASPHSALRKTEDQTPRMIAAVKTPGVAILGHPRGRVFNTRPGVSADWDAVFEVAARLQVAVELDGNWHRQDIDYVLAARALEAGCIFALDSDAHSIGELRFSEYALAHARLAGIPSERVINCWSDERLSDWMNSRHAPRRRRASKQG
jgi:putative hydrolase